MVMAIRGSRHIIYNYTNKIIIIIIIINLFCHIYNQIADIIVQWQATRKTEVQLAGGL